jgi:hypothetical protein
MKEIVMKYARFVLSFAAVVGALAAVSVPTRAESTFADEAAGAAAGYCLASHPSIALPAGEIYTSEGFEIVTGPVVGAIRRNYIFNRGPVDFSAAVPPNDKGSGQTCTQACTQWGHEFASLGITGKPLRFRATPQSEPVEDGIGDIGAGVHFDADFYTNSQRVVVGMSGRPRPLGVAVAPADFCCCQMREGD